MMFKDHCDECQKILGNPWECVHKWLDEFAIKYFPMTWHRAFRHHKAGVEEIRKMWGDEAAKAAEIHIRMDFPESVSGFREIPTREDIERKYRIKVVDMDIINNPKI